MPIDITSWGISESNSAVSNSKDFNDNIASGQTLYLPEGTYKFNMLYISGKNNVEFYGDPNTIIKFKDTDPQNNQALQIKNADNFNVHDLKFDGREAINQGGVWVFENSTNGILKNLEIRDAAHLSCVIEGQGTQNVTVEDCIVYGQRMWDITKSKAMILAGGYAEYITFKNCKTYSKSYYNPNTDYSPADHFDSDNGRNIEYHNCVADGTGTPNTRRGVGFWNEAGGENSEDHETSSTYYTCTAIKTGGGLAASENSDVEAHNFTFDHCSSDGWTAWARCCGNFELYDSLFDGCDSIGPSGIRRGGFVIEGAPSGKFIKFKRNKFINTPEGPPHYDNINLYSNVELVGDIEIIDNTFDDNVTANSSSIAKNTVYVHWNIFEGSDSDLLKHESQTNYIWDILKAARTTAINSPTSDATVIFSYGGHSTSVTIPSGTNIGTMLIVMEGTINNDSAAKITAEANSTESWLTFKQKSSYSDTNVSIIIEHFKQWHNGVPFEDMNPRMQP